jgi:hypothetical protein
LPEGKFELVFDAPGELAVYQNQNVLPRAWLVHTAQVYDQESGLLAALRADDFDPAETVLLYGSGSSPAPAVPLTEDDSATIEKANGDEIVVRVRLTAPGWLVLSEVWHPGWRATVNGAPAEVLQANHSLRAIHAPAGESTVHLWFAPASWRWGLAAFATGLAGLLALIFLRR